MQATVEGRLYLVGGRDSSYISSVQVYDETQDTWCHVTHMQTGRRHHAVTSVGVQVSQQPYTISTAVEEEDID